MYDVDVVTTADELRGLAEPWDALLRDNGPHDAQMTHGWASLWWRCYGDGRDLQVLVVRRGREIVGIVPLMIAPSKLDGRRELTFLGQDPLDYADFLLRGDRGALLEACFGHLLRAPRWERVLLYEIREGSPNLPLVGEVLARMGVGHTLRRGSPCPYVTLEPDFAAFFATRIGTKLLTDVRRRLRKLHERASVALEHVRDAERAARVMDEVRRVNRAHFALKGLQNLDKSPAKREYIERLVRWCAERGILDLSVLRADGRVIAYNLGYVWDGTVNYWNTGWDPELAEVSPGKLIVHALLESGFAHGHREFNFLRGDEAYKLEWTRQLRWNYQLSLDG